MKNNISMDRNMKRVYKAALLLLNKYENPENKADISVYIEKLGRAMEYVEKEHDSGS